MIQVKKFEIKSMNMLLCLTVIVLADIVRSQQAQPYQYAPQPYQNAFNNDRRRLNAQYSGFSAGGFHPGDSIKFPDESAFAPTNGRVHGTNQQYSFNARNKKDMIQNDGTHYDDHSHRSNEVSAGMQYFINLNSFLSVLSISIEFYNLSIFVTPPRDSRKNNNENTLTFLRFFLCGRDSLVMNHIMRHAHMLNILT